MDMAVMVLKGIAIVATLGIIAIIAMAIFNVWSGRARADRGGERIIGVKETVSYTLKREKGEQKNG